MAPAEEEREDCELLRLKDDDDALLPCWSSSLSWSPWPKPLTTSKGEETKLRLVGTGAAAAGFFRVVVVFFLLGGLASALVAVTAAFRLPPAAADEEMLLLLLARKVGGLPSVVEQGMERWWWLVVGGGGGATGLSALAMPTGDRSGSEEKKCRSPGVSGWLSR